MSSAMRSLLWLTALLGLASGNEVGWMMPKQFDQMPPGAPAGGAEHEEPPPVQPVAAAAHHPAAEELSAPAVIGGHETEFPAHGAASPEGHGEEAELEEEEHEEEPDAVTWTTALLLIGFLVMGVGILYLVNCRDEDIRAAIWGMINTTVSIFCAATLDNAVFRFFHFQVVLSPPPRGLGLKHDTPEVKCLVGVCFTLLAFVSLHALLFWVASVKHQMLFSIRTIGGHVYAFASILTFAFLQQSHFFRKDIYRVLSVVALAFIVMVVSYQFIMWAGKRCVDKTRWEESKVQRAQMKEMQLDASAISIGFLLCQSICYVLSEAEDPFHKFIPILHGYPSEFKVHSVEILCGLAFSLLVLSAVWSICLRPPKKEYLCNCVSPFVFDYVGVLSSCTGCWCLQRAGLLKLFHLFKRNNTALEEGNASNRAMIVNAFLMSLIAVVCVLGIDKVADRFQKKEKEKTPKRTLKRDEEAEVTFLGTLTGMDIDLENLPALPRSASGLTEMLGDEQLSSIEAGLRNVMTGFGLLVGICWDKAFETAHETVAVKVPAFHDHPVLGTGLVAAMLLLFVLPAWYFYIVPNAMKKAEDHQEDIERHLDMMKHSKGPQVEVSSSSGEGELSTSET